MRDLTTGKTIKKFMVALGRLASAPARVYFTGGATAVLMGWRESTIDIDLRFDPDRDELYRALPALKEELKINIELASPSDFIPPLPGWEERSAHIGREGKIDFYHYDPYSQALSKIERGHTQDVTDVESMLGADLLDRQKLFSFFQAIEPQLYRYPAVDPDSFSKAVLRICKQQ